MLRSYATTDIGQRRQLNQDFIYLSEGPVGNLPNVFIVADGMGGHNAGDYASRYAVETVVEEIEASFEKNPVRILGKAIERANTLIRRRASEDISYSGMGTTMVIATFIGRYLEVANIGDSRLYVVNERIRQITQDHSLVEEMVRMGGIDRASARNHPDKNIITRAVGVKEYVLVDFFEVHIGEKEKLLLCTDGLTNMLRDDEIHQIIESSADISEAGEKLIEAANENGGRDNIAVVLVEPFGGQE